MTNFKIFRMRARIPSSVFSCGLMAAAMTTSHCRVAGKARPDNVRPSGDTAYSAGGTAVPLMPTDSNCVTGIGVPVLGTEVRERYLNIFAAIEKNTTRVKLTPRCKGPNHGIGHLIRKWSEETQKKLTFDTEIVVTS